MARTALLTRLRSLASRAYSRIGKALRTPINVSFFARSEKGPQARTGDFRSFINGLYRSEWTMAGVMRIADAIMFHGWSIKDENDETIEDRTERVVSIWNRPNPTQTWVDFIEAIVWFWLPLGNAFIWKRPNVFGSGGPAQLWIMWPDTVKIIPDATGRAIEKYQIIEEGKTFTIPREEMLQIRFGNPRSRHWGLGRIEAAERVYDMDIAAGEYGIRYFDNDATPGGVLKTPGRLDPETRANLKEDWNEKHRGEHRAHGWTILEEGLDWQSMNNGPREALFLETRKSTREAILGMLGVPPEKVGLLEHSNKATSFVSERSWQRDTIAPLLKRLDIFLTTITQEIKPGSRFEFEELVQEDNVEDVTISAGYFNLGALTPNEVRTIYAGLPRVEDNPAMDEHYLPVSAIPAGQAPPPIGFSVDPTNRPAASTNDDPIPPPAPPMVGGYMALRAPGGAVSAHRNGNGNGNGKVARKAEESTRKPPKGTPIQQRVLRSFRQQQVHQTRVMRRKIAQFFRDQSVKVIERFLNGKAGDMAAAAIVQYGASKYADAVTSIQKGIEDAFDLAADERAWNFAVRAMFSDALEEEFEVTARLLGQDQPPGVPFGPGEPGFEGQVNQLAGKVSRVSEQTKARLSEVVERGVAQGLSPTQIARGAPAENFEGISGMFEEFSQERSQLIARTESARALDRSNVALYRKLGVEVVDVIGCEDNTIMPGQKWGCNSQGIPAGEARDIEFHPNHKGAIVPRISRAGKLVELFDRFERVMR